MLRYFNISRIIRIIYIIIYYIILDQVSYYMKYYMNILRISTSKKSKAIARSVEHTSQRSWQFTT